MAPAFRQVVAVDLDEGLNGLVSYRMQVGMPRMDFLINSSSGVVVTSAELDRERIAEYQLRVVASDAGTPTKSATSTLTIRGERRGCLLPRGELLGPGVVPDRLGSPRPPLLSLSMGTQDALLTGAPPQPCHSVFASTKSKMPAEPSPHRATAFSTPRGLDPLPRSPIPPSVFEPGKQQRGLAQGWVGPSGLAAGRGRAGPRPLRIPPPFWSYL